MSQSQPTDQQRLHVAMITEGTYPFHFGGVSTWCHLLLEDLWDVDFTLISLVGSPDAELQFPLPSNVVDFRPIPLWGVREAAENRSRLGLTELLNARARTSEQAITHEFIPQFRSFLHELYADKADLGRLAESIHGMYKFFVAHDFDRTLRSKAAWQCFLTETQEFFPRLRNMAILAPRSAWPMWAGPCNGFTIGFSRWRDRSQRPMSPTLPWPDCVR